MKLITDWRRAWRFASVQAAVLLALLSVLQAEVLPLFEFAVPPERWPWVTAGFGTAIVLLRLLAQSLPDAPGASDARSAEPPLETITVAVPRGVDPGEYSATLARHSSLLVSVMKQKDLTR